ncbi:MAG: helix-turn-helix domain-containing protein [Candidatus Gastranaerophilales bacterium]|nr:helix-turn-helix domain-containing protein [Candidatus Gastranaerophilales bacterium]
MTANINLWTFDEFCKVLKANPNTVKTWKRRKDLPEKIFFKIGGTLYIIKDSFEAWVKEKQAWKGEYYGDI